MDPPIMSPPPPCISNELYQGKVYVMGCLSVIPLCLSMGISCLAFLVHGLFFGLPMGSTIMGLIVSLLLCSFYLWPLLASIKIYVTSRGIRSECGWGIFKKIQEIAWDKVQASRIYPVFPARFGYGLLMTEDLRGKAIWFGVVPGAESVKKELILACQAFHSSKSQTKPPGS